MSALTKAAETDERVVLLAGDIGYRLFDDFESRFSGRYLNVGIAEANMASMAAGLAMSGLRPFIYTIAPFVTYRCMEQIRVDICYHENPVTIVGVGAGYTYGGLGSTHQAMEDIAMLRALPNMKVVCPGDPMEVEAAVPACLENPGPIYLRIGRQGEPVVHPAPPPFEIGKGITVSGGDDVSLICTGNLLPEVVKASKLLTAEGIKTRVVSMHTVKPLDEDLVAKCLVETKHVFTVEEHSIIGGLGSAIIEFISDNDEVDGKVTRIAAPDEFMHRPGEQEYLRHAAGLDSDSIANVVRNRA